MVSMLAFYSDDPSSKPTDVYSFSVKFMFEKNENKQERGRDWPIKKRKEVKKALGLKFVAIPELRFLGQNTALRCRK